MATKDKVKNTAQVTKGKIKEVTGKVLGNKSLESKGDAEQIVGTIRKNIGDAKSKAKNG